MDIDMQKHKSVILTAEELEIIGIGLIGYIRDEQRFAEIYKQGYAPSGDHVSLKKTEDNIQQAEILLDKIRKSSWLAN